jgi:hypothetical protein
LAAENYFAGNAIVSVTAWTSNALSYQPSTYIDKYTRKVDIIMDDSYNMPIDDSYNFTFDYEIDPDPTEFVGALKSDGTLMVYNGLQDAVLTYTQGSLDSIYALSGATGISMRPYKNPYFENGMILYVIHNNIVKKFGLDLTQNNSWVYLTSTNIDEDMNQLFADDDGYLYCAGIKNHSVEKFYGVEAFIKEDLEFEEAIYIGYLKEGDISMNFERYIKEKDNVIRVVQPYTDSKACKVNIFINYSRFG